jgi:hypothetical protein
MSVTPLFNASLGTIKTCMINYPILSQTPLAYLTTSPLVKIPVNDLGKVDVFIDDNIAITPDIGDNTTRVIRAIPLAIHSMF